MLLSHTTNLNSFILTPAIWIYQVKALKEGKYPPLVTIFDVRDINIFRCLRSLICKKNGACDKYWLMHPLLSCVQCYKMWWWINSHVKRTVWVLQFYIIVACCEDIYMYSFYYGCTSKKVTMITSTHSLPLHFIVLKIRKVLHFLLSRMNKLDHDFLNWQILSLVCPLRNHVIKLLFLFHLSPSY